MTAHILVVDDDRDLAEMLGIVLRSEGMTASFCYTGSEAIAAYQLAEPDLVLLDLMLPGMDGLAVCRALRAESGVPIVMLTARGDTADVVEGLQAGADDYIVKPFKPRELIARIQARLRGATDSGPAKVSLGDLRIDTDAHAVTRDGEPIALTPLEFDLLLALARRPGYAFSREELLSDVWGYRHAGDTRLVNVHVQRLRGKVERDPENPELILTVRGVGYRSGP
ncbi:MAG: MtrAB system response regulator MtrA [Candidatus Nanopelagicales bacterium]